MLALSYYIDILNKNWMRKYRMRTNIIKQPLALLALLVSGATCASNLESSLKEKITPVPSTTAVSTTKGPSFTQLFPPNELRYLLGFVRVKDFNRILRLNRYTFDQMTQYEPFKHLKVVLTEIVPGVTSDDFNLNDMS